MELIKNLKENIISFPLIFLSILSYIATTILHSLYLFKIIENGNLLFFGIIILYGFIFIFEFSSLIKINDKITFNENNKLFDLENILYYIKNKLPILIANLLLLIIFSYIFSKISLIISSNFQLSKLIYLIYILKFIIYYIVVYNIKQNLINDETMTGFIREIKTNYFLSMLGIVGLFFFVYVFNFLLINSNSSILMRFLIAIPIAVLSYIYHIYLLSFE